MLVVIKGDQREKQDYFNQHKAIERCSKQMGRFTKLGDKSKGGIRVRSTFIDKK